METLKIKKEVCIYDLCDGMASQDYWAFLYYTENKKYFLWLFDSERKINNLFRISQKEYIKIKNTDNKKINTDKLIKDRKSVNDIKLI